MARWFHPELGAISPGVFIPVAEDAGLVAELDASITRSVCRQLAQWRTDGLPVVPLSVNLSTREPCYGKPVDMLRAIVQAFGLPPRLLEVELTESALMCMNDEVMNSLHTLRESGFRLSIDDFGTGYSSLGDLKRLPQDVLKIDRSFVNDLTEGADDAAICAAILALARQINPRVVTEGVETEAQRAWLQANGCDEIHGFLFSKPLPAEAMAARLTS